MRAARHIELEEVLQLSRSDQHTRTRGEAEQHRPRGEVDQHAEPTELMGALSLGEIGSNGDSNYPLFHNAAMIAAPWR